MILRRFNAAGIEEFRKVLAKCRETPETELPLQMLGNRELTTAVEAKIEVEHRQFKNRREAAEYLYDLLETLNEADVAFDAGLWTWLTLFYFDEVCPLRDGKRVVKNDYYYIFKPRNQRHFYRHLLFIAWRIVIIAPHDNRLFLDVPVAVLDKATTEVMKKLYLTRIKCVFEVLDRIYWDNRLHRIRLGVVSPQAKPGDLVRRFPIRIRQLEMTYDLQSLNADQLIELLGAEFQFDQ